ncbi:MAG: peptidase, partial [Gemmatimonadota bacterium]|nr:peptidase [Gemmatimonadota bacterium]
MKLVFRVAAIAAVTVVPTALPAQVAQESVDLAVVQRIREEGLERSQLPALARHLTEVIGPRLTGSPQMKQANEWTAQMFREWGLTGVTVEPWGEFGRGWERVSYSGRILSPFVQPLHAQPVGWTGSTNGTVTAEAVVVKAESAEDLT